MLHVDSEVMLKARAAGSVFESHPDFNTISAFFLGCVFAVAFQGLIFAPLTQRCARLLTRHRKPKSVNDVEAPRHRSDPANGGVHECETAIHILLFAMFLSFTLGSISDVVSLMSGRPEALCAFAVSWGIMASKFARLLGLIMLLMTTHRLNILPRWELITIMFFILILFALILVDGALNTGTVKVAEYLGMSFCVQKRVLPASLTSSLVYIFLELYFIARLAMALLPCFSNLRKEPPTIALLQDNHLQKACSLLFFELLVVVPSSVSVNKIGFFIPTTLGSLVVLTVFSLQSRTTGVVKVTSDQASDHGSLSFSEKLPASPIRITASHCPPFREAPSAISHPYSSASLSNPALLHVDELALQTSKSRRTFDSRPSSIRSPPTVRLAYPSSRYPSRIVYLPGDVLNAIPRQLSTKDPITRKVRPKLTVVTRFSTYDPNNHRSSRTLVYNDAGSTVEMVYELDPNSPHTAPIPGRFSPPSTPSDFQEPESASTVTPKAETIVPVISDDPHVVTSCAGSQTRVTPHTPGSKPKGPRTQLPGYHSRSNV
ncbi:hypothetical protein L218DRAFT_990033 [Marasmius fiardii PR-910]|nr:hypothetical protein L218DRAFT_990033 [Marasmius fiardii PR-910]